MKKTPNDPLFGEANTPSSATTATLNVPMDLQAQMRHTAHRRLQGSFGMEPEARDVPRRRETAQRKRKRSG